MQHTPNNYSYVVLVLTISKNDGFRSSSRATGAAATRHSVTIHLDIQIPLAMQVANMIRNGTFQFLVASHIEHNCQKFY